MNCQSKSSLFYKAKARIGVVMRGFSSLFGPASRIRILMLGFSVRREATTSPEVPSPTSI